MANSEQFFTPTVRVCTEKCFQDIQCTGGYFFDTEKTCYLFGTAAAEDQFCDPPIHSNPDVHRFDCMQAAVSNNELVDALPVRGWKMCSGVIEVAGLGQVSIVSAKWNKPLDAAGTTSILPGGVVAPSMKGRSYFAEDCQGNDIADVPFSRIPLLGRTFRYQVDLSGVECGCNAALYFTMMSENPNLGECEDRYCDASNICGVKCDEIDVQEANMHAWYTTLHAWDDPAGVGGGYGAFRREWNSSVYGPGAECIDTRFPFQVAASFPVGPFGLIAAMNVELEQPGKPCKLSSATKHYSLPQKDGMGELSASLERGVTPIISYWGVGEDMSWVDGGLPGQGPACVDRPKACGEQAKFWGFSVDAAA